MPDGPRVGILVGSESDRERMQGATALLDEHGRILFSNESITRLFGVTTADMQGQAVASLLGGATAEYFAWAQQRSEPTGYGGEVRPTKRKGEKILVDVQISA